MTRTQIQLPDEVYDRARKVCKSREISLAELARRGLEYILSVYATPPGLGGDWQPPKPRRLGWRGLSDAEIKAQAQLTVTEAALTMTAQGVTEFATVNAKDYEGLGFRKVWNPLVPA